MEVARIATLRGHKVTIYEKSNTLGGVFIAAAAPSFKEKDKKLIDWYRRQIKKLNIEVKFNSNITSLNEIKADEIVIATGSIPKRPPIPGIEKTIEACQYLNGKEVKGNVVIIGGGLSGCEIAYDLLLKGQKPMIVESMNDLMCSKSLCLANSSYLRDYFAYKKMPVYLEAQVKKINDNSVEICQNGKSQLLKADYVISAVGYRPAPIAKPSKHVHLVGDALKVGNLRTVVWRAWEVAEKI